MASAIDSRSSRRRPRLWMVFAAVGVSVFVLALGGQILVRVYDDALIRQTESELIAQGAVVAEAFRLTLGDEVNAGTYGHVKTAAWPYPQPSDSTLRPVLPTLHASDPVRPALAAPQPSATPAERRAAEAGERLGPLLKRATRTTLAGIRVLDVQGVVVATSGSDLGAAMGDREEVQRALAGAPASLLRVRVSDSSDAPLASLSRESGVRVTVALPVLEGERVFGAVLLTRTPMTLAKAVYGDRWNLTATGVVLLFAVLLTSIAAAALIVRPVRSLVKQTRAIAAQDPEGFEPVKNPVVQELAELSTALAVTARALRDRNDYIRSFAANVSHEFKTPLAGIRGAVELLRESGESMSPEQRERFLSNVEADAERLTRLVQRLLELARADAMTVKPGVTHVREVLSRLRDVECEVPELDDRVSVPAEVLEDVLTQLIANARQHGGAQHVRVTLGGDRLLRVAVTDDGKGISAANQERIFDPFFTTARARGGTGMGLTIARAMLRPFGGTLELTRSSEEGTIFTLTLERAS